MTNAKDTIDREFIPSLREGVDVIRMIFFKMLRDLFVEKYTGRDTSFYGMASGAVMNELFGTPSLDAKFVDFFEQNRTLLVSELENVAENFDDFRIPLTDALRIHYLCNFQEEIDDAEPLVLKRAKELGVLIEERDVPLPKSFMELVHRLGRAHGILT